MRLRWRCRRAASNTSMASKARWYRVDELRRGGRAGEASALAKEALAELAQVRPWDMLLPEAWWIAHQALSQNLEQDAADAVLAEARHGSPTRCATCRRPFAMATRSATRSIG